MSYSVWCLFSKKDISKLLITQLYLKKKFLGPKFPLHLTLSFNFKGTEINLKKKLLSLKKDKKKIYLKTLGYDFKNKKFQSIFLKIKLSKNLISLKKKIDEIFKPKKHYFFPHISLFYGNINSNNKKIEIKNFPNTKNKFLITHICLAKNDEKKLRWKIIKKVSV